MIIIILSIAFTFAFSGCGDDDDDDDSCKQGTTADDGDSSSDDDSTADDDDDDDDNDDDNNDNDDNDDNDDVTQCDWSTHDPLIVLGKEHLGVGEYYEGYEAFNDAWGICPDSRDARMGLALAIQMELERLTYAGVEYILTNPLTPKKGFGSVLQSMMQYTILPRVDEMREHIQAVQLAAPLDYSFYIETYPFIVQGEFEDRVIADLGGEWDLADTVMVEAVADFYSGLIHFLCAFDLTMDYAWLTEFPGLSGTIIEQLHTVANWSLEILNDLNYPQFLTLLPGGEGDEHLAQAGLAWGSMYYQVKQAAVLMLKETDDQDDDVSGYLDRNGNNQWDPGEPYKVPYVGYLNNGQNQTWIQLTDLSLSTALSTWDGSEKDIWPYMPNYVWLNEFTFLVQAIGLPWWLPPVPINFGPFYYNPSPTGMKDGLRTIAMILYVLTDV